MFVGFAMIIFPMIFNNTYWMSRSVILLKQERWHLWHFPEVTLQASSNMRAWAAIQNYIHEWNRRIHFGNADCHAVNKVLSVGLLCNIVNIIIHRTCNSACCCYEYETWPLTLRFISCLKFSFFAKIYLLTNDSIYWRLRVSKNKVLWKLRSKTVR